MKTFLGGTCAGSTWRDELIPKLNCDFFNPVIEGEWTNEHYLKEIREREDANILLYTISSEKRGDYSIFEFCEDVMTYENEVVICFLKEGFSDAMIRSYNAIAKGLEKYPNAHVFYNLDDVANYLNGLNDQDFVENIALGTEKV